MKDTSISIIIPVLNEEKELRNKLPNIKSRSKDSIHEVILVDGGSQDDSVALGRSMGCTVLHSERANRAQQMNVGAERSTAEILFFLHADTIPPLHFDIHIRDSLQSGSEFGMFAYQFEPDNLLLRINSFFTRFDGMFTGGGDQGLFIPKRIFQDLGGFDEQLMMMEDFDLFKRAKQEYSYSILPQKMTVSSRKYQDNSYLKVQLVNLYTYLSYQWGAEVDTLTKRYNKWIK